MIYYMKTDHYPKAVKRALSCPLVRFILWQQGNTVAIHTTMAVVLLWLIIF